VVQDQGGKGKDDLSQDEFDDNMISNMELTTDDENDENYSLMFVRSKKEAFLTLNARAQQELGQVSV
jgi:hypothetical protein